MVVSKKQVKYTTIEVPDELYDLLEAIAKEEGMTPSEVAETAFLSFIEFKESKP